MFHFDRLPDGLADFLEQLYEPLGFDVERFAALHAFKLDCAEFIATFCVFAHHAALTREGALHGLDGAAFDELAVGGIRGGRAAVVTALLHESFFSADHLGKLLGKPCADVDLVQTHVTESIARHFFAARFDLRDDV